MKHWTLAIILGLLLMPGAHAQSGSNPGGCAGATVSNTKTAPFSNAASASNLLLVTGSASKNIHICALNIGPVGGAVNVAVVEGTTTTNPCDTGTAGVMGTGKSSPSAATGWQIAANGAVTFGDGFGLLSVTATAGDNVCLLFSTAVQVSGALTYTIY